MTSPHRRFHPVLAVAAGVLLFLTAPASPQGEQPKKGSKQIAITFDELPVERSFGEVDRDAITYLLLDALKAHEVKATGFVVGERIEGGFDLLGKWLNDGHRLGNLTLTGQDYNLVEPTQFISDISMGAEALEPMLKGFGQKRRYFRFPFLHYGDTETKRKAVDDYIDAQGYVVCPATVLPEDYLYNLNLIKLGKKPDSAKYDQLMNTYINHVLDELERVEALAIDLVGRPVRQILLLRANRLNAVYLDEMLGALEEAGYRFVTLDEALKDGVYAEPEAYYGLKGLGYLDMIDQSEPDLMPAE